MAEFAEESDSTQVLEDRGQIEDVLAEKPVSSRGRAQRKEEEPTNVQPAETESEPVVVVAESLPVRTDTGRSPVMGHLTVRELEMIPKLDEIRALEEISVGGITNIQPEVIGAIAGVVTEAVEGISSMGIPSLRRSFQERVGGAERRARGVQVEVGRREVILDISVRVIYGYSIPKTIVGVRHAVADSLLQLCGLLAKEINIKVTGIEFPSRMPGRVE